MQSNSLRIIDHDIDYDFDSDETLTGCHSSQVHTIMPSDEHIILPPVVLDTNIFVGAGFNRRSASAAIVEAVREGRLRMRWTPATRRETTFIVRKIPPLKRFPLDACFLEENAFGGEVDPSAFGSIPDPDDRKFAALARAAGAVLVSSDEHLLAAGRRGEITVLTPGAFRRRFSGTLSPGPQTDSGNSPAV